MKPVSTDPVSSSPPTDKLFQWSHLTTANPSSWTVPDVEDTRMQHKRGIFQRSGALAEDMAASPWIRHCIEQLAQFMTTTTFRIQPTKTRGDARYCAQFIEDVWPSIMPQSTLYDLHRFYEMMGFAVAAIDWVEYKDGLDVWWLPTIKPWQPQLLHYQAFADGDTVDMGALVATTLNRGLVRVDPGNSRWLVFSSSNLKPWLNSAVNSLAEIYLAFVYNQRDNMAFQDKYGRGILKFFHPIRGHDDEIKVAAASLAQSGGGGVMPLPRGPNGEPLCDLELLQMKGAGYATFESTANRLRDLILVTMLGQNMTSIGSAGGFAQARIHENGLWRAYEKRCAVFGDARLTTTTQPVEGSAPKVLRQWQPCDGVLRTQLSRWIAAWNFGDPELAPFIYWDGTAPEDVQEQQETQAKVAESTAKAIQSVSMAVDKLTASGMREGKDYDLAYLLEQCGVKLKRPEEE